MAGLIFLTKVIIIIRGKKEFDELIYTRIKDISISKVREYYSWRYYVIYKSFVFYGDALHFGPFRLKEGSHDTARTIRTYFAFRLSSGRHSFSKISYHS